MKKAALSCVVVLGLMATIVLVFLFLNRKAIIENRSNSESYPFYTQSDEGEHLIAHAGGEIDGKIYTNSKEAVEGSVKNGRRFIEIDLLETSDGKFIAGHDWELVNKMIGRSGDKPVSLDEFMASKLYGRYSPLDEKGIVELLEKYPDWIMVSDKTRDVKKLAETFPYYDRIIVQVFSLKDYIKALTLGFKYPVLRLKGGRRGLTAIYKKLVEWVNVKGVILGELSFNKNNDYIKQLHDKGVTVILYGNPLYQIVDNPEAIKKYAGEYIDLVDSDKLTSL